MLYGLGLFVILTGVIYKLYPPKTISNFYAHKTKLARVNEDTWNEAQRFGQISMTMAGFILFGIGFICYNLLGFNDNKDHIFIVVIVSVVMLGMMAVNELHLRRLFNNDGSKKSSV